ncbi:cysteine synthase [Clostridium tetanomorphum]|uniref:PLP-dependent lyase/thiolase n=1 Tax=Clostridium tetanomorphum TaxID=1553 RepID=A0A923EEG9_CLOTT|nr:2-amino-4-oxopentanoate thiolase subunit OrtB [Clostridium tetanomorphum]KAJ50277.1 pyridoxal-5'-phosphate-dependent protein beta subunit [Clostridium tetanomorphum DSM 665]MBC2400004.1 PLP-dependent lyase/thiolase [Clostridium tetanomorphum]MBP1864556.1 cysteine synthase [Clostridium tetanomorphum]NRS82912.1 cysteine synthase [Clostridium tetanomorphum]NRZ98992.1 cysteine synthase [Clostridium tetanomorphum]
MNKYEELMKRKNEIMLKSVGIDYDKYEIGKLSFDYEKLMEDVGYSIDEIKNIQGEAGVGNTPLLELRNITNLAKKVSKTGRAARIFVKDESCNPSGSFKDRRASVSVYDAMKRGYKGVAAATSGNYGAAVASQANIRGLKCIIANECYDSRKIGQPEILEKGRKCEGYGSEVLRLTVGPELFYTFLKILENTGYYNASLYSSYGIAGIETLGYEIMEECREKFGREPKAIVVTHAGGGNTTGTARGVIKSEGNNTKIIGASVDLSGLHMASDIAFNKKSFTTGHTGFGIPFMTNPDRSDVPRSAARPLRYLDRYVTISQGEVFWMTELLAQLEGLERGPAGNTSLAAAFAIAQEYEDDEILVVQETEYTGAGKHLIPQLNFAKENGIQVMVGDPKDQVPGENIILPSHPKLVSVTDMNMNELRKSYLNNAIKKVSNNRVYDIDVEFLCKETKMCKEDVIKILKNNDFKID